MGNMRRHLLFDVDNTIKRDVLSVKEVAKKLKEQTTKNIVKKSTHADPSSYVSKISELVSEFKKKYPGVSDYGPNWPSNFVIVDTWEKMDALCESLTRSKMFSYDTETMGLKIWHFDHIVGASFYTPEDGKAWYLPLKHIECIEPIKDKQLHYCTVKQKLKPVMEEKAERTRKMRKTVTSIDDIDFEVDFTEGVVTFNGKFDNHVMYINMGIEMPDSCHEGYIAAKVLDENDNECRLKPLCNKYLTKYQNDPCDKFDEIFEKIPCAYFPIWMVGYYACKDALLHWEWMEFSQYHIRARQGLAESYYVIQLPVIPSVIAAEREGIHLDTETAKKLDEEFSGILEGIEKSIRSELQAQIDKVLENNPLKTQFAVIGKKDQVTVYDRDFVKNRLIPELNIGSSDQLGKLFYDIFGWKSGLTDKKDKNKPSRSTDAANMSRLAKKYPVADMILEHRTLVKQLNTYVRSLPEEISPIDGKIHTSFNSFGARTNRFSSNDPNLQNIPSRPKTFLINGEKVKIHFGKKVRQLFIAPPGHVLVSTDYSQIEPRITAVMSGCHVMLEAYRAVGRDIYSEMAKVFFPGYEDWEYYDIEEKSYKSPYRANVKAIVLGLTYGMTEYGLAESLNCTVEKAVEEIERFFDTFPEIKELMHGFVEHAKKHGYVECIYHTKRRLPEINDKKFRAGAERQAMNSPIQGSSAEITKRAMSNIHNNARFRELGGRLLLTVHDEVITCIPKENMSEAIPIQQQMMIDACDRLVQLGDILIKVDAEVSERWYGPEIDWGNNDHKEDNDELDLPESNDDSAEATVEEEEESVFA
jgi:DNA polymerase-1